MAGDRAFKIVCAFTLALICELGLMPASQVSATPRLPDSKIVINIPSRTLWLYSGDKIVHWFPVGLGRPGYMTPLGQFKVLRKVVNPGWEHPYKGSGKVRIAPGTRNNPLGTRWIGFYARGGGEYGMHGTDRPSSVGKFSSHGCVRMKIPDAEKLFALIEVGTPVEVIYQPVVFRVQGQEVKITAYPDLFKKGMPSATAIQQEILAQHPHARLELSKIEQALRTPTQQPITVGIIPKPHGLAQQTPVLPSPDSAEPGLMPQPYPQSYPLGPPPQPLKNHPAKTKGKNRQKRANRLKWPPPLCPSAFKTIPQL